jgi:hypothetical protein
VKPVLRASLPLVIATLLSISTRAMGQCGGKPGFRDVVAGEPLPAQGRGEPVNQVDLDRREEGPAVAGPRSRAAEQAERLFKAERWAEAAEALRRVARGETDDDQGNRQIAEYRLAIALYRLGFYHASYHILSEIADRPTHLRFDRRAPEGGA